MGAQVGSGPARSLPSELRRLLEATDGSEQERAWSAFLDSYSRLILYVARRVPRDHDVVMDRYAFVIERLREQSCRRLRTFAADGRGKFTTWLIIVVRRLCLDHDRLKHGRAPAPRPQKSPTAPRRLLELAFDPELLDRLPDGRLPVDEALEQEQLLQELNAAVAALSPRDQLLLTLRYHDDRPAREIASLMSLPTAFHVYRRLNRLHQLLRQMLASRPRPQPGSDSAALGPTAVK